MPDKAGNLFNDSQGSIEQIREIIFGDQMDAFEKQMRELKKESQSLRNRIADLEKKNADLEQLIADYTEKQKSTESDQQATREIIEQLKQEFDQKIAALQDAKVDKSQIGQAFIEWGMKVKQTAKE